MSDNQYKVARKGVVEQLKLAQRLHCKHMEQKYKVALEKLEKRFLNPDAVGCFDLGARVSNSYYKVMEAKVEVKTIPLHGLFIHRKQVWRSLGKLRAKSHSTSAQKVFMNEHNTEVYTENADFIDGLKVTPYDGELPKISKNVGGMSYYQYCLTQKLV